VRLRAKAIFSRYVLLQSDGHFAMVVFAQVVSHFEQSGEDVIPL
jgi:hypothetical protein